MSDLIKDLRYFWSKKVFAASLLLTMVISYATLLLHPTVGIDDTSFKLYYIDGVSPAMGRWCLYMINKCFPLDYNPYFVETLGLLCFCLSVSLWCVAFYRVFGTRLPVIVYTAFACVMISSPILSEVVIWYVQDGIYLGYGMTALAVLAGERMFAQRAWNRKALGYTVLSAALLTVALGFYEAFMIVYLMGMLMVFLSLRLVREERYTGKPLRWLGNLFLLCVLAMVFRSVCISGITAVFHLEDQALVLKNRGLSDIAALFGGWFDGSRGADAFGLLLKEFLVKYTIHGIVYVPVLILVLGEGVLVLLGGIYSVRGKDGWVFLAVVGMLVLPWVMPLLEGTATYYRSSEYVPLLTAFAVLLIGYALYRVKRSVRVRGVALFCAFFLLYQQGYEMNKWLLIDANKYEDDKRTLDALALELMRSYDVEKPICVIGDRATPESLLEKVYTPEWSKKYRLVQVLVCGIDERIFAKYDTPQGYAVAESPQLSFINWADKAYYGFDRELIKFWKMHGFTFTEDGNLAHYKEARKLMQGAPVWPQEGSIVELEEYIIVNFGSE